MAGLVDFQPIQTNDRTTQLMQNELQRCIGQLTTLPIASGILRQVSFSAVDTDVIVPHGFGTSKVEWLGGSWNLPAMVFKSTTPVTSNQIVLRCEQASGVSAANTISKTNPLTGSVWVYMTQV